MNVEDLLEQVICERIEMLINKRSGENSHDEEQINGTIEKILERLNEESKVAVEQLWDEWAMQSAEENHYLYLSGIRDGIRILKTILAL